MMVDGAEERQIMGLIDLLAPYTTTTSIVRVAAWISGRRGLGAHAGSDRPARLDAVTTQRDRRPYPSVPPRGVTWSDGFSARTVRLGSPSLR
jgi:hypothetical protein